MYTYNTHAEWHVSDVSAMLVGSSLAWTMVWGVGEHPHQYTQGCERGHVVPTKYIVIKQNHAPYMLECCMGEWIHTDTHS